MYKCLVCKKNIEDEQINFILHFGWPIPEETERIKNSGLKPLEKKKECVCKKCYALYQGIEDLKFHFSLNESPRDVTENARKILSILWWYFYGRWKLEVKHFLFWTLPCKLKLDFENGKPKLRFRKHA